ncbi:MAG: nuclear transport factor 2 family protein [Chloroflexota bacterium]|nr:nuclear transport factor 2 family protein [Chloroflexota bacterium]
MPTLTHGDGQDLLATFKRGWEQRDPETLMGLFSDDAVYRADPFADELVGANAIRARWNEICAAQVHVEFDAERIWVVGATVLASWHAAYTRRRTAERVRVRGFMTLELNGAGRVQRVRQWPLERVVGTDSTLAPEGGE